MKKQKIMIMLMIAATLMAGCNNDNKTIEVNDDKPAVEEAIPVEKVDVVDNENKEMGVEDSQEGSQGEVEVSYLSPLSGEFVNDASILEKRPIAVMLDNHKTARWQAGVSEAEIVYEILAEGTITRYMALFLENEPIRIGPVRSARPYFINKALEYDAVYTHCGGSEQAFADIKALGVADVDEIRNSGGSFYRYYETGKKGEHTLYTDISKIRDAQKMHKYRTDVKFEPFKFNIEDTDLELGSVVNDIWIDYKLKNITEYKYDANTKLYTRYKDGEMHIDENNKKPIVAKNIIVQRADTNTIDSYGRYSVKLVGKGKGYYVTNGKFIEVTWEKSSRTAKTIYKDLNGNEIKLNPGKTWIQVIKLSTEMKMQ